MAVDSNFPAVGVDNIPIFNFSEFKHIFPVCNQQNYLENCSGLQTIDELH